MTPESPAPSPGDAAGADGGAACPTPPVIPDYELIRVIGRGSYGDVWLARGLTGVYRAIKIVWRNRFADAEPFEREFKGLKKFTTMELPEAGQLALLHVGQNEGAGFFYYVMELADDVATGREVNPAKYSPLTLKEVRARRGRLPAAECVTYGVELARALAGLHTRGLVHRDIKPSNVILVGGVPKLADIGLVASTADTLSFVGTEGFVPPEGPGKPSADVFALGRLLYELATGLDREEFPRLPAELNKVPDRKVLLELNDIILRACEPAADQRYADAGALLTDLLGLQAGQSLRRRRTGTLIRRTAVALAIIVLGATAAFWWTKRSAAPVGSTAPLSLAVAPAKSIAVLPFENMNEDKEDAFFADGIHEEILTDLANIASLRVISRTSVMPYRGTTKTMAQIAKELGVDFILEGSVRRVGQKVRVTGQLIRAAADEQLWAKAYDGDLSDILTLQAQVATTIAEQLKAVLTPDEARRLNAITLADPAAYELYLRGKDLRRRQDDPVENNPEAEALFQRATKLDPKFALPWVELASLHAQRYFEEKSLPIERELAKQALDRAVALAPDRAEVEAGLGEYFYYDFNDFDDAAKHYQRALALEPSNARVHSLLGLLARRQGRWREALVELREARALDPLNHSFFTFLRSTLNWVHAYPEMRLLALAQMQSDPDNLKNGLDVALCDANTTLSRRPLDEWFAALTPAQRATPDVKEAERWLAYNSGEAAKFVSLVEADHATESEPLDNETAIWLATAQRALGHTAGDVLAPVREQLEKNMKASPGVGGEWQILARVCALQGDRARAEFCLQRTAELVQPAKDVINGSDLAVTRVQVLMWLGDKDAAIDLLAGLVRKPAPRLHPFMLKFSLEWWPLRGEPRFEALLADPATYHPQY